MNHEDFVQLPEIIRNYVTYIETVRGRSAHTVDEYVSDLRTFFRFIYVHRGIVKTDDFESIAINNVDIDFIRTITLTEIYEFLVFCKNDRGNNDKTRSRKTSSLKSFFNYLSKKCNLLDHNPVEQLEAPKSKKSLPKYLTLEQSYELLNNVSGDYRERDYAILIIFLNCGLRLSELCGLNITDINLSSDSKTMRVLGKGNKERVVYLNDACVTAIKAYLKVRPVDDVPAQHKNALFLSRLKRRISNKTVQHIVYSNLEKIGLGGQGFSAHKLRHTAATLMYQYGHVDVRVLKDVLGHENLGTTQIYTHLSNQMVKDAIEANPLSNVKLKPADDKE